MRRAGRALAVAVLVVLAGCTGLPEGGPVQPGRRLGEPQLEPIRIVPEGPVTGASKEQVALGFLRAGAGFQEKSVGPNVAQDFLVPDAAQRWRPTSSVVVIGGSMEATSRADGSVRVTAPAVARVGEDGRYVEASPGERSAVTLRMERVAGQWRVETPADFGLWLSIADFERLFQPARIYYGIPGQARLVADVRWFPSGPGLVTALARAQARAVPTYLVGAVATGFPPGSGLAVDAVTLEGTTAQVQLTETVLTTDQATRRLLYAQLLATLLQASKVTAVTVTVDRAPLEIAGRSLPIGSLDDVGYGTTSVAAGLTYASREGATLRWATAADLAQVGGDAEPVPTPSATGPAATLPRVPAGWVDLAISADGAEVAGVGGDRKQLTRWQGRTGIPVELSATDLTRPCYDAHGFLWVAGRSGGRTRVWVLDRAVAGGTPREVDVAWLDGRAVVAVGVSPDGTRLALASVAAGGAPELLVAGVVRDEDRVPTSLSPPLRQADPLTMVRDVVWLDNVTMAVIGRTAETDPTRPYLVPLGQGIGLRRALAGGAALLPLIPRAVAVTALGGGRWIIVTTDGGRVSVRDGARWRPLDAVTQVVVPGR